jgi:hypothetical protein
MEISLSEQFPTTYQAMRNIINVLNIAEKVLLRSSFNKYASNFQPKVSILINTKKTNTINVKTLIVLGKCTVLTA